MNNKISINGKLYTLLAVAAIVGNTATAAILAEDTTSPSETSVEVISSETLGNDDVAIDPSAPVDVTPPSTSSDVPPASEPIDPSTPPTTQAEEPQQSEPTPPVEDPNQSDPVPPTTSPVEDPKQSDPIPPTTQEEPQQSEPTPPSTTPGEEPKQPEPTPPTTEPGQPMPEPSAQFNPFQTQSGDTIVGTQSGQVVVQQADGSTQLKPAESVGGTLNQDGTISVTDSKGEMKTLPNTGVKESFFMSLMGLLMLFFGFGVLKPNKFMKIN